MYTEALFFKSKEIEGGAKYSSFHCDFYSWMCSPPSGADHSIFSGIFPCSNYFYQSLCHQYSVKSRRGGTGTSLGPTQVFHKYLLIFLLFSPSLDSFPPPNACRFPARGQEIWGFSPHPLCSGSCPFCLTKHRGPSCPSATVTQFPQPAHFNLTSLLRMPSTPLS